MIIKFDEIIISDKVGGKALSLSILKRYKLPVPDGIVITDDSFNKNGELQAESKEELNKTLKNMIFPKTTKFAVRSSATNEDSTEDSFAGSFDSLLNINKKNLVESIQEVYNSRLNLRVKTYSENRGLSEDHQMCVIVQEMVDADYAGVLFSADPVSKSYDKIVGNYINGLGEDLVSGVKDPKIFHISRDSGKYEGSSDLKKLSKKLWNYMHKIEKIYSLPMDIEWAIRKSKIYILQARPITTLSHIDKDSGIQNDSLTGNFLWTNANVSEAVPDIMTPATWSLLKIFHEMGPLDIPKIVPSAANIAGRPYINVSFLVSMYKAFGKEYKDSGKDEFFGDIPEDLVIPLMPLRKKDILPVIIEGLLTTIPMYLKEAKNIPNYIKNNKSRISFYRNAMEQAESTEVLRDIWINDFKDYFEWTCRYLRIATIPLGKKVSNLRKKITKYIGESNTNDILSNLSGESSSMASLNLIRGMALINKGKLSKEEYIEESGMRGTHEFELSIPDMQENPSLIDSYLESLGNNDPEDNLKRQKEKSTLAWKKLKKVTGRYAKLIKEFHKVAELAGQRELVRAEMIRTYRTMRFYYQKAGELLKLYDDIFFLEIEELVDMLSSKNIDSELIGKRKSGYNSYIKYPQYPGLIKGSFDPKNWNTNQNKSSILYNGDNLEECFQKNINKYEVYGHGASTGIVIGRVRILNRPEDSFELLNGEILVAVTTNIGWTPLFAKALAVVTDVGAPLSHAAIVARELGIPAVVGCGNATNILKTGDLVTVNGTDGTIKIETKENQ
ncbi:MAG: phosphoenolpyruvate synthase [bacterium]|nr:phosphoenolpyruvate synthase [bacterium]